MNIPGSKLLLVSALLLSNSIYTHAQQTARIDSGAVSSIGKPRQLADSVKKGPFQPNPKKAGLFSAIIPGLGQAYNRQYWKLPIVYAGLGVATYLFIDNLNTYQLYRKAYIGRINNAYPTDEFVGIYSQDQLRQLQDDANSTLNMTVLYTGLGFALQVIDAVTSAHLKNFDMSRDISFHPVITPRTIGMGLVMKF